MVMFVFGFDGPEEERVLESRIRRAESYGQTMSSDEMRRIHDMKLRRDQLRELRGTVRGAPRTIAEFQTLYRWRCRLCGELTVWQSRNKCVVCGRVQFGTVEFRAMRAASKAGVQPLYEMVKASAADGADREEWTAGG